MGKIKDKDTPASTIEIDDISVVKTSGGTQTPEEPEEPVAGNMIQNGDFAAGEAHWVKEIGGSAAAEVNFADEKAVFNITEVGDEDWNVKLKYEDNLKLEKGATYQVKMKIKSTAARTVKYSLMNPSYAWYGGEDLELGADEVKEVDYEFTVDKDTNESITFAVSMGKIEGKDTPASTIEIDDISVVKISEPETINDESKSAESETEETASTETTESEEAESSESEETASTETTESEEAESSESEETASTETTESEETATTETTESEEAKTTESEAAKEPESENTEESDEIKTSETETTQSEESVETQATETEEPEDSE